MNMGSILSKGLAIFVGIDIMAAGANVKAAVQEQIDQAPAAEPEVASVINLPNLQSDLEFNTRELLLSNDVKTSSQNILDLNMVDLTLSRDGTAVRGPMAEKVATDWVEPEPKTYTREFTYPVKVYTEEEIANNALTPYKVPQDTNKMFYYYGNMADAVATPYCPEYANDEDVYLMAKIIHSEICVLGDEARRCVGTVILNRAWNSDHPNTISGVINEPGQFSTSKTRKEPCEECLAAAYDVLYNGYRSFPHYVDAFQCICDGYFSGHATYIAFDDGKYRTWFSYKANKTIITSLG